MSNSPRPQTAEDAELAARFRFGRVRIFIGCALGLTALIMGGLAKRHAGVLRGGSSTVVVAVVLIPAALVLLGASLWARFDGWRRLDGADRLDREHTFGAMQLRGPSDPHGSKARAVYVSPTDDKLIVCDALDVRQDLFTAHWSDIRGVTCFTLRWMHGYFIRLQVGENAGVLLYTGRRGYKRFNAGSESRVPRL